MTPPVKPRAASKNFLFVDLNIKTNAAPVAVKIHVNNPAYKACITGDGSEAKKLITLSIYIFVILILFEISLEIITDFLSISISTDLS